ncbi:hypothetical protein [Ottowia thiooxydans]|uniref:hypothetical protein n=1 Tax=Ottowia thiooxydans TaxID=219182 RepID=UPI00339A4B9D
MGSSPTVSAKANEKALAAAKNKSEQEPQATQEQVSRSRPSNQKRQHEKEIELTPMKNQGSAGASESKKPAEISKPDSNPASEANESNSQPVTTKEKSLRERAIEANEKQNQLKEQELSNREADEFNRSVDQWEKNLSRKMDSYRTISAGSEATNQLASGIGASARAWNENRAAEHDAEKSFQNAAAQKHEMDYQQQNEIFNQSIENSRYVLDKLDASLRSELEAKKSIARNMA